MADHLHVLQSMAIDETSRDKKSPLDSSEALELVEQAREKEWRKPSFIGDLFMGAVNWSSVLPFPGQDAADREIGDRYLSELARFLSKEVDADQIDRAKEIPAHVMEGLARLGAFGMKIPKQYGGLGLSHHNYNRALALVASHDASIATLLSAHQSIGVPQPLLLFGTDEQKKRYLPRFARGEISAFALTEPEVGSDPAKMSTTATPTADGKHFLINGTKLWCTNGVIADVLVVMAQTASPTGDGKKRITAFIVEKDTPGLEVVQRCSFMGLHGIQNAVLRFNNVTVPNENILWGLGKGLRLAFITLNAGRLSLPAAAIGAAKRGLDIAREWSRERVQWGMPIGHHEAIARQLASMTASIYAMEAMTRLVTSWVDADSHDVRLESAMAKLFCSERGVDMADALVQIRGGRGYETPDSLRVRGEKPYPVERFYRDARINKIVEGTSEILRFFIAREGLDRHVKLGTPVLDPRLPASKRVAAAAKAGLFYIKWLPSLFLNWGYWPRYAQYGKLAPQMRFVDRNARKLARTTFLLMLRHGPKLERRQLQLMRLVDIATDLFAMAACISHAFSQTHGEEPASLPDGLDAEFVARVFSMEARYRIKARYREIRRNQDSTMRTLARQLLGALEPMQPRYEAEPAAIAPRPPRGMPARPLGTPTSATNPPERKVS